MTELTITWKKLGRVEWAAFANGVKVAEVWSEGAVRTGGRGLKSNMWRVNMVGGGSFSANTRDKAGESIARRIAEVNA